MEYYGNPIRRRIPIPKPAAGADWTRNVDTGSFWVILGLVQRFVTSAAVANRAPSITAGTPEEIMFRTAAGTAQVASLTRFYSGLPGVSAGPDNAGVVMLGWPANGLWLPVGYTLSSSTPLIDVADQYDQIVLNVIEYPPTWPVMFEPTVPYYMKAQVNPNDLTGL